MALVVAGLLNKQVAGELGISEITVKARRGQVMQKMKVGSLAELVKMAARLPVDATMGLRRPLFPVHGESPGEPRFDRRHEEFALISLRSRRILTYRQQEARPESTWQPRRCQPYVRSVLGPTSIM